MNDKVGFREVQMYAEKHNIDFNTAAKELGLSEADAKALMETMTGNVNWGKVMDEATFGPETREKYNAIAERKARDYKSQNLDEFLSKKFVSQSYSGEYFIYQKDIITGKESYEYYAKDGTPISESEFKKRLRLDDKILSVDPKNNMVVINDKPEEPLKWSDEQGKFSLAESSKSALKILGTIVAIPFALFTSCTPADDVTEQFTSVSITINKDSSLSDALAQILKKLDNIAGAQGVSNEILAAILQKEIEQSATAKSILDLISMINGDKTHFTDLLNQIIAALGAIQGTSGETSEKVSEILETLKEVQNSLSVLTELMADTNANISDLKPYLQNIQTSIQQGNTTLSDLKGFAEKLLEQAKTNNYQNDTIINILNDMKTTNSADIKDVLTVLEEIKNITTSIDDKLTTLTDTINKLGDKLDNTDEIRKALEAILDYVGESNEKADITNQLLEKLINMYKEDGTGGISKEDLEAIINAIAANGDKIDATNQLLAKIQNQDEKFQKAVMEALASLGTTSVDILNTIVGSVEGNTEQMNQIIQLLAKIDNNIQQYGEAGKDLGNKILAAIKELGVDISGKLTQILNVADQDADNGKNIQTLLNKVLAKMDELDQTSKDNTKAIIDAIANIKVGEGGTVDLSSLEKMLSDLLQLTSKNNSLLESIDGKMDVINLTIERAKDEILAKLGENNANTQAILAKLNEFKNISDANSEEILKKMDTIINVLNKIDYDDSALMAKLDDILAAIKDHNVTVDITGKVTCECNCGGNHEGIIGDLEDILG